MKKFAIIALICLAGCLFQGVEREGFSEKDLTVPTPYAFSDFEEKPRANSLMAYSATYRLILKPAGLFAGYKGVFKIYVENIGVNDIFVYGFAIKINGKEEKKEWNEGKTILAGENKSFIFSFNCPPAGNYTYEIGVYLMAGRDGKWHDYGLEYIDDEKRIEIEGYEATTYTYKLRKNYYIYFDRINKLIDPYDITISNKAHQITSKYGDNYNIAKVCAIFDWVYENVEYKNETGEKWNKPSQALYEGGDCEEFAMLISAMVEAIGGTARVYITKDHAFSAIYIGRNISILKSIDAYYHANLNYALISDKFGYWIVADPLNYFYLGGLPVGGIVKGKGYKLYNWSISTNKLYAIDVLKE